MTRERLRDAASDGGADTQRLFFALWPDAAVRAELEAAVARLRAAAPAMQGRWTEPGRYHVTLRFLGEVDRAHQAAALQAAARVQADAFDLVLDRVGSFGGRDLPAWLGCTRVPAALQALWEALGDALAAEGLQVRAEPGFVPHVTLLRGATTRWAAADIVPVHWPVREFVLVRSVLGGAPAYHPLARWPLPSPA